MPAEVKALRKFASDDPTDSIRTVMRGPRPASSVEPVRLPMGMDRSPVGTWLMRVRTVSRISACRWLKAAMLLCTAVMWPSVSFSKDTRPSYCSSPFSMASYTASLTMRVTVLDTRVVAMLSSRGRIWVAAMKSTVSARAISRNARARSTRRRSIRRR